MPISKEDLNKLKRDLKENNPSFLNRPKIKKQKKIIKGNVETKKKIIEFTYKVNDLVYTKKELYLDNFILKKGSIGLIVSNEMYFGKKVQQNKYFILIGGSVLQIDAKKLRKL